MKKLGKSTQVKELVELAKTETRDGVLVSLRCYFVAEPSPHYEIVVNAHGQAGVVDVPTSQQSLLPERAQQTLDSFLASVKIRSGQTLR